MRSRRRPGQSLIEVTIATLVAAITTTAVFSVVLSSFVSDTRADKRDAAAGVMRHAQEALKSFVSADPTNPNYVPTGPLRGVGRWDADTSDRWALADGTHDISSILAGTSLAAGGSFTYTVTSNDCLGTGLGTPITNELGCKTVSFRLQYTD